MNFVGVFLLSAHMWIYPEFSIRLFTDDPATIAVTVKCMHVVIPAMYVFSMTSILLSTVEASGYTIAGFLIEFTTMIIYTIVGYSVCIWHPQEVHIAWMSDYVYFALLGLFSILFLWKADWKSGKHLESA